MFWKYRQNKAEQNLYFSYSVSTIHTNWSLLEITNHLHILGTCLSPSWYRRIISGPSSNFFITPLMALISVVYFDNWVFWSTQWVYFQLARLMVYLHCCLLLHLYFSNRSIALIPWVASDSIEVAGETNESILEHLEVAWMKTEDIWEGVMNLQFLSGGSCSIWTSGLSILIRYNPWLEIEIKISQPVTGTVLLWGP